MSRTDRGVTQAARRHDVVSPDMITIASGLGAGYQLIGALLTTALQGEFGQHPHIGDIRGRGLFPDVEIVEDRNTKAAFAPARAINARVKTLAFEAGLICYPLGGSVDGTRGNHVLLARPYIIEDAQIDQLAGKLSLAITGALA